MAVFVTGDTHGSHTIRRLAKKKFDSTGLTRDDYVIILGDFGLVWSDPPDKSDEYWLDWLEERPWTTLFIDGNHENHDLLRGYPSEAWHGGRVGRIREHVLHLRRGEIFDMGGITFFAMGGAHSNDIECRTEGKSWWRAEVPDEEERQHAVDTLERAAWEVDCVLTHQPPASAQARLCQHGMTPNPPDEYAVWLQEGIADKLKYKAWFFGHIHLDMYLRNKLFAVYSDVLTVEKAENVRVFSALRAPVTRRWY